MKEQWTFEELRIAIIDILSFFTRIVDEFSDSGLQLPEMTGNTAQEVLDQRIPILDIVFPHVVRGFRQLVFNLHGTFTHYLVAVSDSSSWFREFYQIDDKLLDEISVFLDIIVAHYEQTKPLPEVSCSCLSEYAAVIALLQEETRWYFQEQKDVLVVLIFHALTSELTRRQECAVKLDSEETVRLERGLKRAMVGALSEFGVNLI